ncbi:hypothetical protein [Mycolicibacterium sp. CBMA 226]|uniref:hypothetical protein n=1 Tax=Mycolicibacterium sp. CBMA 226 TaxID=2606611 RepID=UPI0012DF9408|nr:hypothetical protein [Mycolicibacterium sp. CBMA 226]MUL75472.1 hypothetical protein [Mycolicibacterium sp. CBMA 226]
MSTAIRPRINTSASLLVAGAVAAAPIVMLPVHQAAPALSTVAVRPASAVTDALNLFGDLLDYGYNAVSAPIVAIDNLPVFGVATGVVALQQPGLAPSALSAFVQTFANPAYPGLARYVLLNLGGVSAFLPAPLGPFGANPGSVSTDLLNTAATIGGLFNGLPDPTAGYAAIVSLLNAPGPISVLSAATQVIPSVLAATRFIVSWAAHLPATLEATAESAIRNPSQIPGLLSNLVTGVLGPTGLLAQVALNLEQPFLILPAPIGGSTGPVVTFVQNVVHSVSTFVGGLLPAPVTPTPFAAVKPSAVPTGAAALTLKKPSTAAPTASTTSAITASATAASAISTGSTQAAGKNQAGKSQPQDKHADKHSSPHVTAATKQQDDHHK